MAIIVFIRLCVLSTAALIMTFSVICWNKTRFYEDISYHVCLGIGYHSPSIAIKTEPNHVRIQGANMCKQKF